MRTQPAGLVLVASPSMVSWSKRMTRPTTGITISTATTAQKARLEAAGINADMMYGNGAISNTSAASPAMTSGEAATPMDWSSLGSKRNYGQSLMEALTVQQMKANIRKTNAEADTQETEAEYSEEFKKYGLLIKANEVKESEERIYKLMEEVRHLDYHNDIENERAVFNSIVSKGFEKSNLYRQFEAELKKYAADAQISYTQAELDAAAFTYRLSREKTADTSEKWAQFDGPIGLLIDAAQVLVQYLGTRKK